MALVAAIALAGSCAGGDDDDDEPEEFVAGLPKFPAAPEVDHCIHEVNPDGSLDPSTMSPFTGFSDDEVFCSRFLSADVVVEGTITSLSAGDAPAYRGEARMDGCDGAGRPFPVVQIALDDVITLQGGNVAEQGVMFFVGGAHTNDWSPSVWADENGALDWSDNESVLLPGIRIVARLYAHPETGTLAQRGELFAIDTVDDRVQRQDAAWREFLCHATSESVAVDEFIDDASGSDFVARIRACTATPTNAAMIEQQSAWADDAALQYPSTHDAAACGTDL